MKLDSDGILLGLRPINERDSVAYIFTREYGMLSGVMRGAVVAKKNRPLVGQVGAASWNARLDTQLGAFHWEPAENVGARLMLDMRKLAFMNAAFALLCALLPEREQYTNLYDLTISMLRDLDGPDSQSVYMNWEIALLHDLGFALDLTHCAQCGRVDNLNYLSPKTGRAVCDDCAAPYVKKLYKLPINLDTTLHFIVAVCAQMGIDTPTARLYLARL
jgi:DNA repair protein RecO (recombination protein O)